MLEFKDDFEKWWELVKEKVGGVHIEYFPINYLNTDNMQDPNGFKRIIMN